MKNNEVEITITDELRKALVQLGAKYPGKSTEDLLVMMIREGLRRAEEEGRV